MSLLYSLPHCEEIVFFTTKGLAGLIEKKVPESLRNEIDLSKILLSIQRKYDSQETLTSSLRFIGVLVSEDINKAQDTQFLMDYIYFLVTTIQLNNQCLLYIFWILSNLALESITYSTQICEHKNGYWVRWLLKKELSENRNIEVIFNYNFFCNFV